MNDFNKITKIQFDIACNNHKPNKFLEFMYSYFSTDITKSIGSKIIIYLMAVFNVFAIIFDIIHTGEITKIFLLIANLPFFLWGFVVLIAFLMNQFRIKSIAKELGITTQEYNLVFEKFS